MTAHTPNLPALIAALPGDETRAPQTEFTRGRQVRFLENLSLTGSVRSAAAAGGVSHQTAYRARRAIPEFRLAWDAALLAARVHAEQVLAARAIDGVEEKVFYHGEQVDTRTRYSDRLLLAHLARLDRLVGDERVHAVAEDFDAALARFAAGEAVVAEAPEGAAPGADIFSPGPCNTRSMSPVPTPSPAEDEERPEADEGEWDDDEPVDWDDEDAAATELVRIELAMMADRPADSPRLTGYGPDGEPLDPDGQIADAQWQAFERGVPRWWQVVPPVPEPVEGDGEEEEGEWRYADDALIAAALKGAEEDENDEDDEEDGEGEGEEGHDEDSWENGDEDEAEEDQDEADGSDLGGEGEVPAEGEPAAGEPSPEAPPAPAPDPSPPPQETARRWTYPVPPPNDGRCQPYYGRGW